jgi:hypothetical protein
MMEMRCKIIENRDALAGMISGCICGCVTQGSFLVASAGITRDRLMSVSEPKSCITAV